MRKTLSIMALCWSVYLGAQDINISSPLDRVENIDPAAEVFYSDKSRIGLIYSHSLVLTSQSDQWRGLSAFYRNIRNTSENQDRLAWGFGIDKAGAHSSPFQMFSTNARIGYQKSIFSKNQIRHLLAIGTTVTWSDIGLSNPDLWYGSQYDVEKQIIDRSIPSGEREGLISDPAGRPDFSLGINWQVKSESGNSYVIGSAIHHLFSAPTDRNAYGIADFERRYTYYGSINHWFNKRLLWSSSGFIHLQGGLADVSWRNVISYLPEDAIGDTAFSIGIAPRFVDHFGRFGPESIRIESQVHVNRIKFGLAYKITISELSGYIGGRGGIEISMGYDLVANEQAIHHRL